MTTLVAVLLIALEPLRFAGELLSVAGTIRFRGPLAIVELIVHAAIAALCVMAGFALLNATPDARRLARLAILVSLARVFQSTWWSRLPSNLAPGDEWTTMILASVAGSLAFIIVSRARPSQ